MARDKRVGGIANDLQRLSATMEGNKDVLPNLEPFRLKLAGIVAQIVETGKQQDAMRASKQASSKQLRQLLKDGQRTADLIRTGVRDHFGPDAEKIAEFGMQPFRGRKVKAALGKPTTTNTPTAPAADPTPAK